MSSQLGTPVYSDHAIAAYFAYFAKMHMSHIFPHVMAFSNFEYLFMHLEYLFMHKFAKIRIQSHFSAYTIAFSAFLRIFVQGKHAHTTFTPHISVMLHICSIYVAYFSAYFAKFRIFFPHNLHQNGPHIKKNFRYKV